VIARAGSVERIFANDAVVQRWEAWLFGTQISYEWIRAAPSAFWSGVLHLAYLSYYPIIVLGPVTLFVQGDGAGARHVLFTTMLAFAVCYAVFLLFPVAGPNYVWPHPTGAVRQVWSARIIYGMLANGSSIGAAFPSSHVAATVAAVLALWRPLRPLAIAFAGPAALLVVGTIYCQMHYGVDVLAGLGVAIAAWGVTHGRAVRPASHGSGSASERITS
jgi:membrane-associated phospholipid phosphatase